MSKNILITGATGLLGKQLVPALLAKGHQVSILSRKKSIIPGVKVFKWDVYNQTIEKESLDGIDTVIHLAGEGIADKKWTAERKQQIIDSRVKSANLLYNTIDEMKTKVTTFVSAAAVGYYGNRGNEVLLETSGSGTGFLSDCCVEWEKAADEGLSKGIRVVKVRIGLILSEEDGLLATMEKPIKLFIGSSLGTGKQWMPWVHLDDVVNIFVKAVEDEQMTGPYNACAPAPVSNTFFTETLGKKLGRPVWPIHVPTFVLKAILGEMSILPLISSNTTSQKILDTGYRFSYVNLDDALDSIYHQKNG